jgi:hypothetical protein
MRWRRSTGPSHFHEFLESLEGMSAIRVCDRESEPAGLNYRLTIPAHSRHDLQPVMLALTMTVCSSRYI